MKKWIHILFFDFFIFIELVLYMMNLFIYFILNSSHEETSSLLQWYNFLKYNISFKIIFYDMIS